MNKDNFAKKFNKAKNTADKDFCSVVIKESLTSIPNNLNNNGTMNSIIVMEELSELSKEVSKAIRGKGDATSLLEEMADVYLGIKYLQEIYNISDEALNKAINVKLNRQNKRNNK